MNHIFQASVLIIECIELNWLCKYMKKIRSSQPAIPVPNWVKHQSFPVSIVKELDPTKAHGHDNISIRMIKLCVFSISKPLHIPFNVPFNVKGMFPQWIKKANIVPVYCNWLIIIDQYWLIQSFWQRIDMKIWCINVENATDSYYF